MLARTRPRLRTARQLVEMFLHMHMASLHIGHYLHIQPSECGQHLHLGTQQPESLKPGSQLHAGMQVLILE